MTPGIYLITGPPAVGKTTISKELARRFDKSVHINGDFLYSFVIGGYRLPWEDDGTLLNLLWKNLIAITRNFIEDNYVVIIDYIIFKDKLLEFYKNFRFNSLKYIILWANEKTLLSRDSNRDKAFQTGNRSLEVLKEFEHDGLLDKYLLDTGSKKKNMIIDEIISPNFFVFNNLKLN